MTYSPTTSVHTAIFAIAIALGIVGGVLGIPQFHASAQGGGPHPVCVAWVEECKKGKCPPPPLCKESKCEGICAGILCKGIGCSGNDKGDGDKAGGMPEMPKMPEPPKKEDQPPPPQQPCVPTPPPPIIPPAATTTATSTPTTTPGILDDHSRILGGASPCPVSSTPDNTLSSYYNDIFGSKGNGSDSGGAGSTLKDIASDILSSLGLTSSDNTSSSGGKKNQEEQTNASTTTATNEGDIIYETEEVRAADGSVTLITRGRQRSTNTGITGFFGRLFGAGEKVAPSQQTTTFFSRLCAARPWQVSLVLRVFSTNFFDALCKKHGQATSSTSADTSVVKVSEMIGRARLSCPAQVAYGKEVRIEWSCYGSQSAGTGFNTGGKAAGGVAAVAKKTTTYLLRCGNTGHANCTTVVGVPHAEIVVQPPRVGLNERARLFWTSEGVSECTVTGPGVNEKGVRGAATTLTILDATTFTIACKTSEGLNVHNSVTVDVGS